MARAELSISRVTGCLETCTYLKGTLFDLHSDVIWSWPLLTSHLGVSDGVNSENAAPLLICTVPVTFIYMERKEGQIRGRTGGWTQELFKILNLESRGAVVCKRLQTVSFADFLEVYFICSLLYSFRSYIPPQDPPQTGRSWGVPSLHIYYIHSIDGCCLSISYIIYIYI